MRSDKVTLTSDGEGEPDREVFSQHHRPQRQPEFTSHSISSVRSLRLSSRTRSSSDLSETSEELATPSKSATVDLQDDHDVETELNSILKRGPSECIQVP